MEFLASLKGIAYDASVNSNSNNYEGDFWALLLELRDLGVSALLWDDSPAALQGNQQDQTRYLEHQASTGVHSTPQELVYQALLDERRTSIPMHLQRRRQLLKLIK